MERYKGCKLDPEDSRDLRYSSARPVSLPLSVDLRPTPAILDQGQAGTCVLNASAIAYMDLMLRENLFVDVPSRLFMRWITAEYEGDEMKDAGVCIRDAIKMFAKYGACSEYEWPYDLTKIFVKPTIDCYYNAKKEKALEYRRVVGENDLKACLAEGYGVIIGIPLDEYFEGDEMAQTGKGRMFDPTHAKGGHGVYLCGYNEDGWIIQNSWGTDWGMNGYFTLPYGYPFDDCWSLRKIG